MERVLLLNATFEPLRIISWKKAITLLFLGKVEVIEEYDREIRSVSFTIKLPSVVKLIKYIKYRKKGVKFSRQNIYARDNYTCQYCGRRFDSHELTLDHVVPKWKGGQTRWENIVTCCIECNRKKGGRLPKEAGLKLIRKPHKPDHVYALKITFRLNSAPESWRDYLYWNVELVD